MPNNKVTISLNANWPNAQPNVIIFGNVTQAGSYPQRVSITGPYTDPNHKPAPRVFEHGSMSVSDFGDQIGKFFDTVQYEQFKNYLYDLEFTHNGGQPSNVVGSHGFPIVDKAFGVEVLSNDSGSDADYNDLVVTLTMFKQSTD